MIGLQKFFKDKKVLITGHTGFKGSWISQILISWGAKVSGISLKPVTKPNIYEILDLDGKLQSYIADIRNFKKIQTIFEGAKPEIVFHLAAQPIVRESYDNPLYTMQTNVLGTANLLEAVRLAPVVRAVVVVTTDKVYEDLNSSKAYKEEDRLGGHDPYATSKASVELIVNSYRKSFFHPDNYGDKHQTLVASARAGNVIGGGDWARDRIIPDLVRAVFERDEPLFVRSPKAVRPWQHVLQPLHGYLLIAQGLYEGNPKMASAWNLGPDKKSHEAVEKILSRAFAHLDRGSFTIVPDYQKHETAHLGLDSSKARRELGWRGSFPIKDSIEWTLDWYKHYYEGKDTEKLTNRQIKIYFQNAV